LEFQAVKLEVDPILLHWERAEESEKPLSKAQLALDIFPALLEKEG
jgi:hypothetical protein